MRFIFAFLATLLLSACASGGLEFAPAQMAPNANVYNFLDKGKLTNAVDVGSVTLSEKMPEKSWVNGRVVTGTGFKQTLTQTLQKAHWLNTKKPTYTLNAYLVEEEMPFAWFKKRMFTTIQYSLVNNKTQSTSYQENIKMSCPVAFAFNSTQLAINMEEALRCSLSENVTQFMRSINSKI